LLSILYIINLSVSIINKPVVRLNSRSSV